MDPLLGELCGLLTQGESIVLATIFDHQGSTPRTSGARMIIRANGEIVGTIGGGLLEARVIRRASLIFQSGCSVIDYFALNAATADSMDMICGGNLSVLLEFIAADQDNRQLFCRWRQLTVEGGVGFVLTLLPDLHPSSYESEKCLIEPDGAVTGKKLAVDIDLPALLESCRHMRESAVVAHGRERFYIEPIARRDRLMLFGAGHVSQSVARLASTVGFGITVVDDRPEFANRQRFSRADEILVPKSFEHVLKTMCIDHSSYIVIVTRGHVHDHTVLAQALETKAGYIGMIGSKRKRDAIYAALLAAGFSPADMERVHSPIGIEIGAETPEEIAVSIVAELVAVRANLRNRMSEETHCADGMPRTA
jgi:xanthine dehydrogenase accessory factor